MKVFDGLYAFVWHNYRENNCNTYLINGDKKILIDPGHQHLFGGHVANKLNELNINLNQIDIVIATHGHPDHLEAVRMFNKSTLYAIHPREHLFISELAGHFGYEVPQPNLFLQEGDLSIGAYNFQVISTPGHSPGSICLYWPEKKALFSGDVIFYQGIGRTDIPGGEFSLLKKSIRRLQMLDVTYLLPGHGDIVIGKEKVQKNFREIGRHWFNFS